MTLPGLSEIIESHWTCQFIHDVLGISTRPIFCRFGVQFRSYSCVFKIPSDVCSRCRQIRARSRYPPGLSVPVAESFTGSRRIGDLCVHWDCGVEIVELRGRSGSVIGHRMEGGKAWDSMFGGGDLFPDFHRVGCWQSWFLLGR
jgi:hypothetical protein